jgi:acyl carrier protein|tara:strand:+ start:1087 stop:1335 length:249 start_codon:yes stop_codon:yes gene_type:complete
VKKKNLNNVTNGITELLVKKGVPKKKINNKYNFVKSKDLDSLNIILFITEVEKKFSIKFKKNDLLKKNFQSIDGLSKIIKNI